MYDHGWLGCAPPLVEDRASIPCRIGTAFLALDNHHSKVEFNVWPELSADELEAILDLLVEICHHREFGSL